LLSPKGDQCTSSCRQVKGDMPNFITPGMIVNAAKLVTRGKLYALGFAGYPAP
jgi:hypothetical protein